MIVWDIINESGLFRLKGHKGVVTQTRFLTSKNILISRYILLIFATENILKNNYFLRSSKRNYRFTEIILSCLCFRCSSKDTFVKFWDLDTQHCFKTVVGHKTEVWDFVIINNDTRLITGSGDNELRIWLIDHSPQVSLLHLVTQPVNFYRPQQ